ncbi:hypothetical protein CAI16_01130 [Virgibacillus dokdonensis]|uniref:Uncharacterized protein n=1 Tax=Virgibacillus dokdonensis TaxID=302167 RepID=A0A3E0WXK3_9BACI|nr:hypothetical protein [Virgibacillus dokdonensis]RFA37734.1 hypothetical protein CAI16_01130 [Virgibacillus dokdonensis]
MGWKSIELQVAIPRSLDASKMQQQLLHQSQLYQASLSQQQLMEAQRKRKQVHRTHQSDSVKGDQHTTSMKERKANKKEQQVSINEHPYLGTEIDVNG